MNTDRHLGWIGRLAVIAALLACASGVTVAAPAPATGSSDSALDLAAFRGKVVMVEFWTSWCVICKDAFPWLGAMQSEYGSSGLVVIAVNVDQNRSDAEQFLTAIGGRDLELRYDPTGALAERFHIGGMPTEIVFDRNGVERFRHNDFLLRQRNKYESELRRLLDGEHSQ
jgi:thiol-disulfide isomerase/thioredoxin